MMLSEAICELWCLFLVLQLVLRIKLGCVKQYKRKYKTSIINVAADALSILVGISILLRKPRFF
jgi:hypothetical protein